MFKDKAVLATGGPSGIGKTIVEEFKKSFNDETFGADFEAIIADSRYKYITSNLQGVKIVSKKFKNIDELTKSDKIDKVLTNKWLGIPIFLTILFLVFHLTFSENLFFLRFIFNFSNIIIYYSYSYMAITCKQKNY